MNYSAPLDDMKIILNEGLDLKKFQEVSSLQEVSSDLMGAILEEANKYATSLIAPSNKSADSEGAKRFKDGRVQTPKDFPQLYKQWCEAGWNSLSASQAYGGQNLPCLLASMVHEIWASSNMAFHLCPLLTAGAIEALEFHASDNIKATYLPKLVSGEWTGTMNLTEPQAGSDLNLLKSSAEPQKDGSYLIKGQKIYITYGEHDMADNIIHLVLARLPDAPEGTKGISLFLVPKLLEDGTQNDVYCAGLEHKLGIHASPTCTMIFGDKEGAKGWLIGEENKGLACMFTMMNNARLNVGLQGVGLAERALQQATSFANERVQGTRIGSDHTQSVSIYQHRDVQLMLMQMDCFTMLSRNLCYACALALDLEKSDHEDKDFYKDMAALLTPIAKAFSTDYGVEVTSLGIQIYGGMGYIEEAGMAQYWRDSRIAPIYEGTNGIQAIDLTIRKIAANKGISLKKYIELLQSFCALKCLKRHDAQEVQTLMQEALLSLSEINELMLERFQSKKYDEMLCGAQNYLKLLGLIIGGAYLYKEACNVQLGAYSDEIKAKWTQRLTFFIYHLLPQATGLSASIKAGKKGFDQ